ncbi:MAG TPA: hypothetical protein DCQ26_13235 [Marinilabiliales bacterium]|jgi:hypothetical protein|nr:MAG: hypothetical protein A2W95_08555 [Bacteroidetes bacterium GWA2_40_14]OFX60211.1 MAG: hypothetical protein A2W84_07200 [Bacteroidetes bacterium GWC2_40_13]OFX75035.1 MAG: hypothetical protein A2W96_16095 [Bacteroidetes bacterium GWD2_40_43]OFX89629.1 MAG: hypothetical protein A2W97_12905 [Bacteroidetes bacterium GWE2_40_63]OFY24147.1 MAG: hypothetical protein A2W88_14340 [Bacteroidetes bacterium GWF2_40_13]OFZ26339.1 MAG: hypothetical protein A2437_03255 [Bacteroidetes bacterium RIFOXYC
MKIVEAVWEKRNLGVVCKEITFEAHDSLEDLSGIKALVEHTEYLVVKVPTLRYDLNQAIAAMGLSFIEVSIHFELMLKNALLSGLQTRLNNSITYAEMEVRDLELLFDEIRDGMFASDRILLDPAFTSEQAANRYIHWIQDEIQRGAQVYKILHKNQSVGFFTFKEIKEGIYYPFLAGMYKAFAASGLGFTTLRKPIDEAIRRGGQMISTYTSSNNLPVVRAHIQQGFSISGMYYVFIKHN